MLLVVVIGVAVAVAVAVKDPSGCFLALREPPNPTNYDKKIASTSKIPRKLRYEMLSGGPEAEEANFMTSHTILIDFVPSKMDNFQDHIFI